MDKPITNYPRILLGNRPLSLRELFSSKARWTQGADGKDSSGNTLSATNPEAVRWCTGGGLSLVYGHDPTLHQKMVQVVLAYLQGHVDEGESPQDVSINGWNDEPNRSFKDIRKLVTEAEV
jgi:hypothetical protein